MGMRHERSRKEASGDDEIDAALARLASALEEGQARLRRALEERDAIARRRADGHSWIDIVVAEDPPTLTVIVNDALQAMTEANARYRRALAAALHRDGLPMQRIAALFGVTRQRVSHLLQRENL
jgi:hypothetical protein